MNDDANREPNTAREVGDVGLSTLLNILWRRRWIVVGLPLLGLIAGVLYGQVVTPLYLATATIRPGITSFDRNGGGRREWRLKDVTRWYGSGMYRHWTAREMGVPKREVPLIRADFIQRGLQNIQGGNVITLTCMDASAENAVNGIDASIDAFASYAMSDSLSNSILLTRRGLGIQIDELRRQQAVQEARVDSLNAGLAVALIDSGRVDEEFMRLEHEVELARTVQSDLERRSEGLGAQLDRIREDHEELTSVRARVRDRVAAGSGDQAEALGELATTSIKLERLMAKFEARIDSLDQAALQRARNAEYFDARNQSWPRYERARKGRSIASMRSARDFGVPNAIRSLELRVRELEGQLASLSPIEKIGQVEVTDRPVRPRKQRAIMILTVMGLVAGVVGAFVFDYVWTQRRAIFRS